MSDIEFVDGLFFNLPHENAPDFVKGSISIKRKELGNWLRGKEEDVIRLQVKESKGGKIYVAVDNWKPEPNNSNQSAQAAPAPQTTPAAAMDFDDDIPFMSYEYKSVI